MGTYTGNTATPPLNTVYSYVYQGLSEYMSEYEPEYMRLNTRGLAAGYSLGSSGLREIAVRR